MKRNKHLFMAVVILSLSLMSSICFAGFAHDLMTEGPQDNAIVSDETGLNVRSGPGTEYKIIEKVPYGAVLYSITERGDKWLQVIDTERKPGWVRSSLVEFPDFYVGPNRNMVPLSTIITADSTYIRVGASTACRPLEILKAGDHILVFATALHYHYVSCPEKHITGWIPTKAVENSF